MKRITLIIGCVVSVAVVLFGCGPTAHIERAKNVNLNSYKTFAWAQRDVKKSRGSVVEERIRDAVSQELSKTQNWQEVRQHPDVILSYDVLTEKSSRVASDPVYSWGGYRTFYNPYRRHFYRVYYPQHLMGFDHYRVPIKEGTITITIVDANTDQAILQGWATDELNYNKITSREVNRIVTAIFRKWAETSNK